MTKASLLRKGNAVLINGDIHILVDLSYRSPGKGAAFYQFSFRNLANGKMYSNKYRPNEELEQITLVSRDVQFLYHEGDLYYFMKLDTYEQIFLSEEIIGDNKRFLKDGLDVIIMFHGEKPIELEMPVSVSMQVISTVPGHKGDTVSNVLKPATVENGYEFEVPLFIKEGDIIKIDTRTGDYLGKDN
ncbi:elongation factor P [bacterium]|nr:elongation factor P [bacterium]MCP5463195.1 elongation factor P [bacterium]